MRIVIVALLALLPASAMAEGSNAGFGYGGNYSRFDPVVAQYNASGELFRISGHCQSSCTLFLGIRNVCIERSALLLFHSAHDRQRNPSPSLTVHMLDAYNPRLRAYLTAMGIEVLNVEGEPKAAASGNQGMRFEQAGIPRSESTPRSRRQFELIIDVKAVAGWATE